MKSIIKILIFLSFSTNVLLGLDLVKTNSIVNDDSTKMQWQDDESVTMIRKNWYYAINYCKNLSLDGHNDWRLPNKDELLTLIDYSKSNPAIKENAFENITSNYYWSSVPNVALSEYAWYISFDTGLVGYSKKDTMQYTRCVRIIRPSII